MAARVPQVVSELVIEGGSTATQLVVATTLVGMSELIALGGVMAAVVPHKHLLPVPQLCWATKYPLQLRCQTALSK
jgi:hypothetical protein